MRCLCWNSICWNTTLFCWGDSGRISGLSYWNKSIPIWSGRSTVKLSSLINWWVRSGRIWAKMRLNILGCSTSVKPTCLQLRKSTRILIRHLNRWLMRRNSTEISRIVTGRRLTTCTRCWENYWNRGRRGINCTICLLCWLSAMLSTTFSTRWSISRSYLASICNKKRWKLIKLTTLIWKHGCRRVVLRCWSKWP